MKKLFVVAAMLMAMGTSTLFANGMETSVETVVAVNDFTPIEVKDLPQAVQDALKKDYAGQTVKEASVEEVEGVKTYKVVLTDEEGTETTVFFNENGEVK